MDILKLCFLGMLCSFWATRELSSQSRVENWPRVHASLYSTVPDLSFLNEKPAGLRGRVTAQGADLVFADGTPARFWGANLQAYALFSTRPANIRAQAKRIAALGFNLVRIHHHDSGWVSPNVFGKNSPATRNLNPTSMGILDQWIGALKDQGVYVWLDLHVDRRVTAEDGIQAFGELAKGKDSAGIRGFNYVSETIRARMLEFQNAYLGHVNAVTGLTYRDDPAVIAVLITNENDLTFHFGNALLPGKGVPQHSKLYTKMANTFAGLHGLEPAKTRRAWGYGPPKLFLNDLEHRFNTVMKEGLREDGFGGLIATTNSWGGMPLASLPSLSEGSLIDVHSYGRPGELTFDPATRADMLSWIAAGQVAGLPLSVSEWNVTPFPAEDRFIAPLRMATSAAHQGWDAPMIYGYAQQALNKALRPGNWDVAGDPAMLGMLPAAALLYRHGHVQPARQTYAIRLTPAQILGAGISPETSIALRTLYEQSQVVVELPEVAELDWLEPRSAAEGAIAVTDPDISYLPDGAGAVAADTGEFQRDFRRGLFTVDTVRTQLAAGRFNGSEISLSDMDVRVGGPMAAVVVQSLDGKPINQSGRLLISVTARIQPVEDRQPVYFWEPLQGELSIRAPKALTLKRLDGAIVSHRVKNGRHVIDLSDVSGTQWLFLER